MVVATAGRESRSEDGKKEEEVVVSPESLRRLAISGSVLPDMAEEQDCGVEGVE